MSLKNAWLGLIGRLPDAEPLPPERVVVDKPIPVGEALVDVYCATSSKYMEFLRGRLYFHPPVARPEWHGKCFWSCDAAFKECGKDAEVSAVKAWIHEGKAYFFSGLNEAPMMPKPKVAKGRK